MFVPAGKKLILASQSPRRKELLQQLGLEFEIRTKKVDEIYPSHCEGAEIAEFIATKKAFAYRYELEEDEIVLAADTVVLHKGQPLGKPSDADEAREMLTRLSGEVHDVTSAVCLLSRHHKEIFSDTTRVHFKELKKEYIEYYIDKFKPFDKAGSYGIQEWLGMIGISRIEGSYFTVVGLPTHPLLHRLSKFQ